MSGYGQLSRVRRRQIDWRTANDRLLPVKSVKLQPVAANKYVTVVSTKQDNIVWQC